MTDKRQLYRCFDDHDLLVELNVRQDGIYDHLERLNGTIAKHDKILNEHIETIATLRTRQEERTIPPWLSSRPRVIGIGSLFIAIATLCSVALAEFVKAVF